MTAVAEREATEIGLTPEGRPLLVERRGRSQAERRVLVVAGQHGDEPLASRAAQTLLSDWDSGRRAMPNLDVAVLAVANPDGSARGRRHNAAGIDLNRDHQHLRSRELEVLHGFARRFRPQLLIDVHTFKGRRKAFKAQGFELAEAVMLELSNDPSALLERAEMERRLLEPLIQRLNRSRVPAQQYLLFRQDECIRTSSTQLHDARNGLALAVGAHGLLLEGREPSSRLGSEAATERALVQALEETLSRWSELGSPPRRFDFEAEGMPTRARRVTTTEPRLLVLPRGEEVARYLRPNGRAALGLRASRRRRLPVGYAVHRRAARLLAVLRRQGFEPVSDRTRVRLAYNVFGGGMAARARLALQLEPTSLSYLLAEPELEVGSLDAPPILRLEENPCTDRFSD